jgi:cell wall-associated NlpC family hydrolase
MPASSRMRSLLVLPLVLFAMLAGLQVTTVAVAPEASALTRAEKARKAMRIAKNQIGDPYRYGATGPHAFDCSGLSYFAFRKAGFSNIPRTSGSQANWTTRIKRRQMRRGDLMFFHSGGSVYHVAIFVGWKDGRRRLVHSPRSGSRVHITKPWTNSWFPGTVRW